MSCFSGERLKAQRVSHGMSRELLAVNIGRSYHSIVSYEHGRAEPPANVVAALAEALSCDVGALFDMAAAA